jgi:hypothetical protein
MILKGRFDAMQRYKDFAHPTDANASEVVKYLEEKLCRDETLGWSPDMRHSS